MYLTLTLIELECGAKLCHFEFSRGNLERDILFCKGGKKWGS